MIGEIGITRFKTSLACSLIRMNNKCALGVYLFLYKSKDTVYDYDLTAIDDIPLCIQLSDVRDRVRSASSQNLPLLFTS